MDTKLIALISSTIKYCKSIGFLQSLHLPINNIKDRCILYFAIYGQILLIFSLLKGNSFLIEVSRLIFGLSILLVVFCSFNPYLNLFCYNTILFTFITRYIYGGCLFLNCNENNISFLPDCMDFSYIIKVFLY